MIEEEIAKFMALVPLMLPKLIRSNDPDETDITDDSGILFFSLEERLPISIVMDEIDDGMELKLLYHGTSKDNPRIHHCCFFASSKASNSMFKFNIVSDEREFVDGLNVTLYDSLDTMICLILLSEEVIGELIADKKTLPMLLGFYLFICLFGIKVTGINIRTICFQQELYGFHEVKAFQLLDKTNDVATLAATETLKHVQREI